MKQSMKTILIIMWIVLLPIYGMAANNFYGATALTGGASGALDSIDGTNLATGDGAFVTTSTGTYFYYLNAASGAAESSPNVIAPDANGGNKRWIFINVLAPKVGVGTVAPNAATVLDAVGTIRASTGILFGADTAAANMLDDYEEGTYEPTLVCSTSGSYGLDAGENTLAYTKTGRIVTIQGRLRATSEVSPSGVLRLSLPFTPTELTDIAERTVGTLLLINHGGTLTGQLYAANEGVNAYLIFYLLAADGTTTTLTEASVDTDFYIFISFTYIAV